MFLARCRAQCCLRLAASVSLADRQTIAMDEEQPRGHAFPVPAQSMGVLASRAAFLRTALA
jgi:hypothetical protein